MSLFTLTFSHFLYLQNFVEEYQQNEDYVFQNVAVAYKNHLYDLVRKNVEK